MTLRLFENLMTPYGTLTSDATNPATGGTFTVGDKTYTFKTALTEAKATATLTASTIVNGNVITIDGQRYTFVDALSNETKATATLTSDATAPSNGDTVTLGTTTYTFKTALTEVRATGTLTSDGTAPDDGDTVVIGNKTYTFKTALTPTEGEVLIGASAAAALDNLKSAINHTGTPDTDYKCAAAHTQVQATTNTDTTQVVQALVAGTAANAYATTTPVGTHQSWGATTLTGGVAAVANEVLIGVSAAVALDNLKLAVNGSAVTAFSEEYSTGTVAHTTIEATTNTNTTQVFQALVPGTAANSYPATETSSHLVFSSETLAGGVSDAANQVLIDSSDAAALDNLKLAINEGANKGVKYSSLTVAHPTVTATTNTNTTQVVEALTPGTQGNAIQVSGSGTTAVWNTPYLTGGVNPVENEILIGNAAADTLDNVKTTINGTGQGSTCSTGTQINAQVTATTNTDTTQLFTAKRTGVFSQIPFSESATHLSVDGGGTLINKFTAGAGTYNQDFKLPDGAKGANFLLDIDSKTGTLTFDCKIQSRDPETGTCVDVPGASFAQKSAAFEGVLSVYPGLTAVSNVAVTQALPKHLRAVVVVGGSSTPTATFSLQVEPLP